MKKLFMVFIFVFIAGIIYAQQLPLAEVIKQSAQGIEETLPQGTMIAIINFASPRVEFSDYVIEELTSELLENGKIVIVDRRNLSHIREEMNLQLSGDVSDESALSIGRLLGAHYIVTGTLTDMGSYQRFRIRIINVENGAIQRQVTNELQNDGQVAYLLGDDSALQRIQQENARMEFEAARAGKASNSYNNWISYELSSGYTVSSGHSSTETTAVAFSIRYERMFSPKISLGINGNCLFTLGISELFYGIDIPFRFYPSGNMFYLETSLGFTGCYLADINSYLDDDWTYYNTYGFRISPGLGFKVDVGKTGGFYIQPGLSFPLIFGPELEGNFKLLNVVFGRLYFGMGFTF